MGYDSSIGLFRGYAERNFHKCECVVFILTQKGEMQGLYPTTPNKRLFTDFRNFHLQWHVEETEVVLSVSSSLTFIILYSSHSDLQSRCIVLFRLDCTMHLLMAFCRNAICVRQRKKLKQRNRFLERADDHEYFNKLTVTACKFHGWH